MAHLAGEVRTQAMAQHDTPKLSDISSELKFTNDTAPMKQPESTGSTSGRSINTDEGMFHGSSVHSISTESSAELTSASKGDTKKMPVCPLSDTDDEDAVPELEDEIEELMDDTRDDVKFIALPHAPLIDESKEGCKHYRRFCQKKAPCCGVFFPCRVCHNEQQQGTCTVEFDRSAVREVRCNICRTEQPVSKSCIKCGILFGKYYCNICHFWDNVDKGQFHCNGCGICRAGGRDNFIHCDRCRACYSIRFFDHHKCAENVLEGNCPVCQERLHTSRKPLHVPHCGHVLHKGCFEQLIASGQNYTCPTCGKAICDLSKYYQDLSEEISLTPMPEMYAGLLVEVACNECQKKSIVPFHVLGAKCSGCQAYNTTKIRGPFARQ